MTRSYLERFGPANPDRFDTPAAEVRSLYSADSGWNPLFPRPVDWYEREKPKTIAPENAAAYVAQQRGRTASPPKQPMKPVVVAKKKVQTTPGVTPNIAPEKVLERRMAGESAAAIAKSLNCSPDWVYLCLQKQGYQRDKTCMECSTNIGDLTANAKYCRKCKRIVQKRRKRETWRKTGEWQGKEYRKRSPEVEPGDGACPAVDTSAGVDGSTPAFAGADAGAGPALEGVI